MTAENIIKLYAEAEDAIKKLPFKELIINYSGAKKMLNRPNLPEIENESDITPAVAETMIRTIGGMVNLYPVDRLQKYISYLRSKEEKEGDQVMASETEETKEENPMYEILYKDLLKENAGLRESCERLSKAIHEMGPVVQEYEKEFSVSLSKLYDIVNNI